MSFWPFGRRRPKPLPPPRDERYSAEDWAKGDLAECLSDDWTPPEPNDPKKGAILRVSKVDEMVANESVLIIALHFEGFGQEWGYDCNCFRKLRPTLEPATDDFAAWMKDVLRSPEKVR